MKIHFIEIQNPQEFPYWEMRLIFLMENNPNLVQELFAGESGTALMEHLDQVTARALLHQRTLAGISELEKTELVTQIVCPVEEINLDAEPMNEAIREAIWEWTETLPERRVSIEIPQ